MVCSGRSPLAPRCATTAGVTTSEGCGRSLECWVGTTTPRLVAASREVTRVMLGGQPDREAAPGLRPGGCQVNESVPAYRGPMRRPTLALVSGVLAASMLSSPSVADSEPAQRAATNPWLGMRVMDMAHSGGEQEAPTNTMYALKRAIRLGADMLELDVQVSKDDRLVVIHNATVDQTTNGTGNVRDLTAAQIGRLDAAYDFKRGEPPSVPGRAH